MRRFWLGGIVVLAFLLRFVGLTSYPTGFTTDEASYGYDAYSILKTGKDQWGVSWPLTLRASGDFKLPLYSYITVPFVAIFGLNEFAVRFPNALLGTLAILLTYLMVKGMSKDKRLAIWAGFLLAISPWHMSLSRGAFEMNLTTFFIPLGVWAFLKGIKNPLFMVLAAFSFGLNLFSYHSARLFMPLLLALLVFWKRKELVGTRYKLAIFVFGIFVAGALYSVLLGAGTRASDISIFSPTDKWLAVSQRRHDAVVQGLPDQLARVFNNKASFVFDQLVGGYLGYFSPQFLFTQGVGEWTYGMIPGRGVLYLFELPFILAAVSAFILRKSPRGLGFVLVWILLAPIAAALTKGLGFAGGRVAGMMPAIQILSAYGALVLWDIAGRGFPKYLKAIKLFSYLAIGLSLILFLEDYRYHAPVHAASSMHYGKGEVVRYVSSLEQDYDEIVFSRSLSTPNIWVAFYNKWDPADYQKEAQDWFRYEKEGWKFLDQLDSYSLGKYTFSDVDKQRDGKVLMVGKPGEFPKGSKHLRTFNYPDAEEAYYVEESGM